MRNYTRLLDILDRVENGPIIDETEFDRKLLPAKLKELQRELDIRYDRQSSILLDDALADRLFEAGLRLATDVGVLCTSTGRRITFTRQEILDALEFAPQELIIGRGLDRCTVRKRQVEDRVPPGVVGGPIGQTLPEELFLPIMQSYAQEPIVDTIINGTLLTVYNREPKTHSPWEVLVAWHEAELSKTAVNRAGRPGLAIGCVETSPSEIGEISASSYGGFSPYDWHQVAMVSELKTNYALLAKIAHLVRTGCIIHTFYNPIFGGYAGGAEGVAITAVAGIMLMQMVYMTTTHSICPTHPFFESDTAPEIVWAISAAQQAINRNTHLLTDVLVSPVGGPCTKVLLYETAVITAAITVSGTSRVFAVRSTAGKYQGYSSGLEARFSGEVGQSVAGMSRREADEIVKRLIPKYVDYLDKEPKGKRFDEAYDMHTLRPTPEWQSIYEEVKEELRKIGIPFKK
ncbi:MAG: monomethylamine:corrinoid methyltransferase [Chloroflexi bacterium]|nr:monomethylamine:corrinoid methyltransferase [Chloroflexota bacterium]MCL5076128.1 monomethylamine:corrinoid methyltransferase [Chloroflexota bacterium]